jgi:hypothetical protein
MSEIQSWLDEGGCPAPASADGGTQTESQAPAPAADPTPTPAADQSQTPVADQSPPPAADQQPDQPPAQQPDQAPSQQQPDQPQQPDQQQAAVLRSITISPANPAIAGGEQQQFSAGGTLSDDSREDVTSSVAWSSSAPDVLSINNSGLATAQPVSGTATITAFHTPTGVSASTNVTVTAGDPQQQPDQPPSQQDPNAPAQAAMPIPLPPLLPAAAAAAEEAAEEGAEAGGGVLLGAASATAAGVAIGAVAVAGVALAVGHLVSSAEEHADPIDDEGPNEGGVPEDKTVPDGGTADPMTMKKTRSPEEIQAEIDQVQKDIEETSQVVDDLIEEKLHRRRPTTGHQRIQDLKELETRGNKRAEDFERKLQRLDDLLEKLRRELSDAVIERHHDPRGTADFGLWDERP